MTQQLANGITELMVASSRGELDRVEALLLAGAEVEARDLFGQTALIYAASAGHLSVVEELLDAGADVSAKNRNGATAFDLASKKGHREVAELLHHSRLFLAARDGALGAIASLLDAGADPNARLRDDWTALMVATLHNQPQAVAALIRRGADPAARNAAGWTALMIAERRGFSEVARLLKYGVPEEPASPLLKPAADPDDLPEFPDFVKG